MKKVMMTFTAVAVLFMLTSCYSVGLAERYRTVTVVGTASLSVVPDTVSMDIRVSRTAEETKDAQREVNIAVAALLDILVAQGVNEDDINTTRYEFAPEYDYSGNQRTLIGQRVSQSLEFSLKGIDTDPQLFPSLLDAVSEVSNITLSSMQYTREDIADYYGRVKALAMEDAFSKGNVYAGSAGLVLEKPLTIVDYSAEPVTRETSYVAQKSMAVMADAPTQIPSGDISVSASVNVVFAMK